MKIADVVEDVDADGLCVDTADRDDLLHGARVADRADAQPELVDDVLWRVAGLGERDKVLVVVREREDVDLHAVGPTGLDDVVDAQHRHDFRELRLNALHQGGVMVAHQPLIQLGRARVVLSPQEAEQGWALEFVRGRVQAVQEREPLGYEGLRTGAWSRGGQWHGGISLGSLASKFPGCTTFKSS